MNKKIKAFTPLIMLTFLYISIVALAENSIPAKISIKNRNDVIEKRNSLIRYIWKDKGFPRRMPNSIEFNIEDNAYSDLDNLQRIDKIIVNMDYGLNSIIYLFRPTRSNNQLVIYHQGHRGNFVLGKYTIKFFLDRGYSVMAFSMPLLGMNNWPESVPKDEKKPHNNLKYLESESFSPIKFFLEPIVVALNYATEKYAYNSIFMVGISGGGWTTTLYSAIDTRISKSYPVAGTLPLYLRKKENKRGDYEQRSAELYKIANYLELYVMGSYGKGRKQLQILNK